MFHRYSQIVKHAVIIRDNGIGPMSDSSYYVKYKNYQQVGYSAGRRHHGYPGETRIIQEQARDRARW